MAIAVDVLHLVLANNDDLASAAGINEEGGNG